MADRLSLLSVISSLLCVSQAQKCPVTFEGRVPSNFTAATFDTTTSLFNPANVFGQGLKWSQIIQLPAVSGSLFDQNTIPVEVTIDDASIFAPSATNVQTGFRRAELLISSNNGTDASTTGIKTVHFSVGKDSARPLNLTHEYQLFFLEDASFSTNQVVLKTGTILGGNATDDPDTLRLFGNVNANPVQTLFQTKFTPNIFHNFAVTLDFTANTTQVFYSTGTSPLTAQTQAIKNDVHGQGQFHFGMLKKPVNGGADITKSGFQESGINEGIVFGGIFEEDSSNNCISLSL